MVTACSTETIRVSDEISTQEYDFENITGLEVATDFKAYVDFSQVEEKVRIEANANLFDKIEVFQKQGTLVVKLKNNVNVKGKETLNLYVGSANISSFKASSDAAIFLENPLNTTSASLTLSSDAFFDGEIISERFDFRASSDSKAVLYLEAREANMNLSSGSSLEGEITLDKADAELSSDSVIDMVGSITELKAELSSDGRLRDFGLLIEHLKMDLSSDSKAYLTVSGTIDVAANSDSRLFYKGDAEIIRQVLTSDAKVIKE